MSSERCGECLWRAKCPWLTGGPQTGCFQGCRPAPLHSPLPIMQHPGRRIYMIISSSGPLGTNRRHSLEEWALLLYKDDFKFILSLQFDLSFKNSYGETLYRSPVWLQVVKASIDKDTTSSHQIKLSTPEAPMAALLTLIKSQEHLLNEMVHKY